MLNCFLRYGFASLLLLISALAVAAESGSLIKNDSLRTKPFSDAPVSAQVQRGEAVTILTTQSGWADVTTAKKKRGWVRILSIKRSGAQAQGAEGLLALNSGRAGTGKIVSTTGVRGLSAEELKVAKYSEEQMSLLAGYQVDPTSARQVAQQKGLVEITFADLPTPAKSK